MHKNPAVLVPVNPWRSCSNVTIDPVIASIHLLHSRSKTFAHVVLQTWLALSNLLSEPATLGRYTLDGPRSAALQRLRRLLNEVRHCVAALSTHTQSARRTFAGSLPRSTASCCAAQHVVVLELCA